MVYAKSLWFFARTIFPKRRSLRSLRDLSTFWVQASVGVGGGVIRRVRILGPKSQTLKSQFFSIRPKKKIALRAVKNSRL